MFRYFWGGIQDKGPHTGLTTHDEALYRLHVGTAIGHYLVNSNKLRLSLHGLLQIFRCHADSRSHYFRSPLKGPRMSETPSH